MALGDRLKKFAAGGTSKSANLAQNDDLVAELYGSTPTPAANAPVKEPTTTNPERFMAALTKALGRRKKVTPTQGVGSIRG